MDSKIKSVVAVGFCCADVYEELGKFYPTGNGIDWGVHLARMGVPVSAVSVVGTDKYGSKMLKALAKEHINVSHMRVEAGDTCVMLMGLKNGTDRIHLKEIEGVMANYALTREDDAFIRSHDMLHTDLFGNVLDHLEDWHHAGIQIVMDFSTFSRDPEYHCEDYFPYVDYAFMSYDGPESPVIDWICKVQSFGPKIVVATRGEDGSLAYDGKQVYRYGIVPCEVVNTVGAGDSYIAGFTYGIINGWDIPACMRKGAEVSSQVITKFEPY
jgi:fructoselysine 6-kinase